MGAKRQGGRSGCRPPWVTAAVLCLLLSVLHTMIATATPPPWCPGSASNSEESPSEGAGAPAAAALMAEGGWAEADVVAAQRTSPRGARHGTFSNPIILNPSQQSDTLHVSQQQFAVTWAEPTALTEDMQEGSAGGLYHRGLRALLGRRGKDEADMPQPIAAMPDLPLAADLLAKAAATGHPEAQSTFAMLHGEGLLLKPSRRPSLLGERDEAAASAYHHFAMLGGSLASKLSLAFAAFQGGTSMCGRGALLYAQAANSAVASINEYHKHESTRLVESVRLSAGKLGGASFYEVNPDAEMGNGFGGEEDETIQFTKLAAEQGDARSLSVLGNLYFWGARGVQRNVNQALDYYRRALAAGQTSAHTNLGEMYARGIGVSQDPDAALRHFQAAVDSGSTAALNGIGYVHSQGLKDKPKNLTAAAHFFKRAAERGQPDGLYNWGVMAMSGQGVEKNLKEARRAFQLASEKNHMLATFNLGKLELHGRGGEKDACAAMAHFKVVAEQGQWGALLRLGQQSFMAGGEAGYGRALLYYLRAAQLGYEVAQGNAAWMLERGMGVSAVLLPLAQAELQSFGTTTSGQLQKQLESDAHSIASEAAARMALRLWRLAAKQGNAAAALRVGDSLYSGKFAEPDRLAAFAMYRTASRGGSAQGYFNMGAMLELGDAVPCNFSMAAEMYLRSLQADPTGWLPVSLATLRLSFKVRLLSVGLLDEADAYLPWVMGHGAPGAGVAKLLRGWFGATTEALGVRDLLERAWTAAARELRRALRLAISVVGAIAF